jgi:hypothetical protein
VLFTEDREVDESLETRMMTGAATRGHLTLDLCHQQGLETWCE